MQMGRRALNRPEDFLRSWPLSWHDSALQVEGGLQTAFR
jgi:hypothetical protein